MIGRELTMSSTSEFHAAPTIDSDPPLAWDRFLERMGISAVTGWRYRRAGMLSVLNICGRCYVARSEIRRFNERAVAGEFAKTPSRPQRKQN